jgi:DNA-binding MarR family transcriptional regulator
MQEEVLKRLHAPKLGPCACAQVRRLARKLSSLYDTLLSPEGLTITQYSLLANIERAGQLSHAVLAEKVGMERTTLTRNLRPLTRAKWVTAGTGEDRRQHLLQLTAAGRRKLVRSLPLWEEAQRQFLSQIGTESLQELRALLALSESAVTKAFTADQENRKPARIRARKGPTYADHGN